MGIRLLPLQCDNVLGLQHEEVLQRVHLHTPPHVTPQMLACSLHLNKSLHDFAIPGPERFGDTLDHTHY
jgi:hypothetical protein